MVSDESFADPPGVPQPWPITVAGIRPYFTIDPNDDGPMPPVKRTSKSRMRIADDIDAKNRSGALIDEAFQLVKTFFSEAHIFITEIVSELAMHNQVTSSTRQSAITRQCFLFLCRTHPRSQSSAVGLEVMSNIHTQHSVAASANSTRTTLGLFFKSRKSKVIQAAVATRSHGIRDGCLDTREAAILPNFNNRSVPQ
jgi:hypothetical protein